MFRPLQRVFATGRREVSEEGVGAVAGSDSGPLGLSAFPVGRHCSIEIYIGGHT